MTNYCGAAAVILNSQGHVLLVKHSYGPLNWEIPGGGSEANESIVETALREVREETGLLVAAQDMTGIYYAPHDDMLHFVFRCQLLDATATPHPDRDEITDCAYWPPEALPRPISDFTMQRIQDALAGPGMPLPVTVSPRQWLE
jgi:8-oxo-dGTP pyrophosphatase MutT (NUDIX family)